MDIERNDNDPSRQKKELTILLLGETGVGKSTFINAFANHLMHETLEEAEREVSCLIPCKFTLYDQAFKKTEVRLGEPDNNEITEEDGASATQHPKVYTFSAGEVTVRLIDTPGIGDTRGVQTDGSNMRTLLNFIAQFKEIDAICILLKPNNSRLNVVFRYCILELLSQLNKSASRNILFLFTSARSTFFAPGDTAPALLRILADVKKKSQVDIPFSKDNVFCFDNESFRFLVAKSPPNNVLFSPENIRDYSNSWERGASACQLMFSYIYHLPPHKVEDTVSINKARTSIEALTQPLGDISDTIAKNIAECKKHQEKIRAFNGNIEELGKELYIPFVDIDTRLLDKPRTVCGNVACCETINVGGSQKTHYKTLCHDPCYLSYDDGSIIGNTGLLDCQAFNKYEQCGEPCWADVGTVYPDHDFTPNENGKTHTTPSKRIKLEVCSNCKHPFTEHLHTLYHTYHTRKQNRDENKYMELNSKESKKSQQEMQLRKLQATIEEWQSESNEIHKCVSIFATFLKNNAITAFNDAYEDYMEHLINLADRDKESRQSAQELRTILRSYQQIKQQFQKACTSGGGERADISPRAVEEAINRVYSLKNFGSKIRDFLEFVKEQKKKADFAKYAVCVEHKPTKKNRFWQFW